MNELFLQLMQDPEQVILDLRESKYPIFRRVATKAGLKDPTIFRQLFDDALIELREKRHTLREDTNPEAWLTSVVRNKCIDWLRAHNNSSKHLNTRELGEADGVVMMENAFDIRLTHDAMEAMLVEWYALPPQCRIIMEWHFLKGLTVTHIATIMDLAQPNVSKQISIGLRKLKAAMLRVDPDINLGTILLYLSKLDSEQSLF